MRIQVLFRETSVLVPCGDGQLSVQELVNKAIVRFKKVLNKRADDIIEVRSIRLADGGSYVAFDDEVADVLEDKEVVELQYRLLSRTAQVSDDEDNTSHNFATDLPINMATKAYSSSNTSDDDHTPFSPDLHGSNLPPTLSSIGENFSTGHSNDVGVVANHHSSQELHNHLEGLDNTEVGGVSEAGGLHVMAASQDLDTHQPWHSHTYRSQSQDLSSPHLEGRKQVWRTVSDMGFAMNKSQESYSQSHPKSQDTFHVSNTNSADSSSQSYSSNVDVGRTVEGGGRGVSITAPQYQQGGKMSLDLAAANQSSSSLISNLSISTGHDRHHFIGRKEDGSGQEVKGFHKITHHDHPASFSPQSHDGYSPSPSHSVYHPQGTLESAEHSNSPVGRGYDHYHSWNYGSYPMPSLNEGREGGYDKPRLIEKHRRRSGDHHHKTGGHYGMSPQGAAIGGGMGGRPPGYLDYYGDHRVGKGRYNHMHDHTFLSPSHHSRLDMGGAGMRQRSHIMGRPGMDDDYNNHVAMDMYLSQPSGNYYSYDRFGSPGGHPMMGGVSGPLYSDPRYSMGGPTTGVSLSQPGVKLSHHHGNYSKLDVDRHVLHPQVLIGGMSPDHVRANSVKSGESLERHGDHMTLSVDDELDDLEEEDSQRRQLKGRSNPFKRDFRKSIFRDGNLYSQWMERMYEYDIQEPEGVDNDIPHFDGDSILLTTADVASSTNHIQSNEESGLGPESGEDSGEEDDEYGNIHIVELHKKMEFLGIHLTHYTSPEGNDLGVYIGSMDEDGFAASSGNLQVMDRILACNGCDFTKGMTSQQVEDVFGRMLDEPLLRMAISRGGRLKNVIPKGTDGSDLEEVVGEKVAVKVEEGVTGGGGEGEGVAIVKDANNEGVEDISSRPAMRTVVPSSMFPQAPPVSLTNTREIGVKHRIELQRGTKGYGIGLTSRDVRTEERNQPVYVKAVHHDGPAYLDRRLQIGDRILEVNDVDVVGLARSEVVQLLRDSTEMVTLLISRQEVVEEQQREKQELVTPTSGHCHTSPMTMSKTVLNLCIPLHNCGPAGLGVTVYTKNKAGSKAGEEMGVYIKSIVPGGAAAMEGSLNKNDQVLSVNQQSLLGHSNHEAMDILRSAMTSKDTVELVVARRSMPALPSMAALGEEPEEEEHGKAESSSKEVGIDVPKQAHTSVINSLSCKNGSGLHTFSSSPSSSTSHMEKHVRSVSSPITIPSSSYIDGDINQDSYLYRRKTSSPTSSIFGSNNPLSKTTLKRSQDLLASGEELYDRLVPLPSHTDHGNSLLHDEATPVIPPSSNSDSNNLDTFDMTSFDRKGTSRILNVTPMQLQTRDVGGCGISLDIIRPQPVLPSNGHFQKFTPSGFVVMGLESSTSLPEGIPLGHHLHWNSPQHHYLDSISPASSAADSDVTVGKTNIPTRGSGRKNRNWPERGSGRCHSGDALLSISPDISMTNGYATMPSPSSSAYHRECGLERSTSLTIEASHGSLENLRLLDSEVNMAFRRDNPGRISITKKTKKIPLRDLAHLRYDNSMPLIEGEKPILVRAGSDGVLNVHDSQPEFMQCLEVGPSLGLVKSSSLESLHNVMHHTIKRDLVNDGTENARANFMHTKDNSYQINQIEGVEQHGVDVNFGLEVQSNVPAMISFTKSPYTPKTKKKGFFQKVFFKKRKNAKRDKASPKDLQKAKGRNMEVSPSSLSAEERDQLMRHYTLQLRPHSSTYTHQRPSSTLAEGSATHSEVPVGVEAASVNRFSMPVLDDYDSPDSNDELLLESMARV